MNRRGFLAAFAALPAIVKLAPIARPAKLVLTGDTVIAGLAPAADGAFRVFQIGDLMHTAWFDGAAGRWRMMFTERLAKPLPAPTGEVRFYA
jgi:hypothetical protein